MLLKLLKCHRFDDDLGVAVASRLLRQLEQLSRAYVLFHVLDMLEEDAEQRLDAVFCRVVTASAEGLPDEPGAGLLLLDEFPLEELLDENLVAELVDRTVLALHVKAEVLLDLT